jgi:hypothetical protein
MATTNTKKRKKKKKKKSGEHVDVTAVLQSHSRQLLHEFSEGTRTAKLAFDRGLPRERAVRTFLGKRLPRRYGVSDGVVVDAEGGQSEQCDVVIYDRERMPTLATPSAMKIWPFETVYAVAQVKSTLTRSELKSAVDNIAAFKKLKRADNRMLGGRGLNAMAGDVRNRPVGILVAYKTADDFEFGGDEFEQIVKSVPLEQQIDIICVVEGPVACRASKQGEATIIGFDGPNGPNDGLLTTDFGDGALSAFLLIASTFLNSIDLGDPVLLRYLNFLAEREAKGT